MTKGIVQRPRAAIRWLARGSLGRNGLGGAGVVAVMALALALANRGRLGPGAQGATAASTDSVTIATPSETLTGSPSAEVVAVDRPTVPSDLRDKWWYALDYSPAQAGQLGTTDLLSLPDSEVPIAAEDGLVATIQNGAEFGDTRTSTIRLRAIPSGDVAVAFETSLYVEHGAFAGGYLFFEGLDVNQAPPDAAPLFPGGGLWAVPVQGGGQPMVVVPPEPTLISSGAEPFGEGDRTPIKVSSSGRTLASGVYLDEGAVSRTDVIDVGSLTVRIRIPGFVYAVTDDVALTAGPEGAIAAARLTDGSSLWSAPLSLRDGADSSRVQVLGALAEGNVAYVQVADGEGLDVARLDLATGDLTTVLSQGHEGEDGPILYFAPALSSAAHLVLLPEVGLGPSLELTGGRISAAVYETSTNRLVSNLFAIGAP